MPLKKSNVRVVALGCFYLLFIVIGASIFSAIEEPQEREKVKSLRSLRNDFLVQHQCMSGRIRLISMFVLINALNCEDMMNDGQLDLGCLSPASHSGGVHAGMYIYIYNIHIYMVCFATFHIHRFCNVHHFICGFRREPTNNAQLIYDCWVFTFHQSRPVPTISIKSAAGDPRSKKTGSHSSSVSLASQPPFPSRHAAK